LPRLRQSRRPRPSSVRCAGARSGGDRPRRPECLRDGSPNPVGVHGWRHAEQARALIESSDAAVDSLTALWALALGTGARQGELLGLMWSDLDARLGQLDIQRSLNYVKGGGDYLVEPKTRSSRRTIHLAPALVERLQTHRLTSWPARSCFAATRKISLRLCKAPESCIRRTSHCPCRRRVTQPIDNALVSRHYPERPLASASVHGSTPLWLSSWLSSSADLAGMDGNRTHPGRLNSAPQTVLKTADCACATVCLGAYKFDCLSRDSARVHVRPRKSMKLAVNLAVNGRRDLGNSADF